MLHLLKSVYTHYATRSGLFSIWYLTFTALKCNFSANTSWFSVSTVSNILCIEIPAYRLCGFVVCFAQPQIYALPSEWYSLRSNSLFHKGIAQRRQLFHPFHYPHLTEQKIGDFQPLAVQKQAAPNRSWVPPVLLSNPAWQMPIS